jgi:UMF1 family MFS transporter
LDTFHHPTVTASKKIIRAWTMYDWANSAYNLVITSTVFPAYFASMTGDENPATQDSVTLLGLTFNNIALYNYSLALGFLIVALISPMLSAIADYKQNKKPFLRFFMLMGSVACALLYFYDQSNLGFGVVCMIVAGIGYWASIVFYNAYLPEIAAIEDRDRISAQGFSMGYIGSVLLQIISFILILQNNWFGITSGKGSQISFLLVGIWWFGFALWPLKMLPNAAIAVPRKSKQLLLKGYQELGKVWHQLKSMQNLKRFLTAFFFYNMGLQTIMFAATLFASSELAIPTTNLIVSILIIQLIAIPGAYAIARLSRKIGNIKAITVCVVIWVIVCFIGYYAPIGDANYFYGLATIVGFVMGGTQSLSRSTYSKLMPETTDTTSFFSFYDVTEKIGIGFGLFTFGFMASVTGSQRISVLSLMVFFIIGLLLLIIPTKKQLQQP